MRVVRTSASIVAAIAIAGAAVVPAWSFDPPAGQMQEVTAEVVPTQDQVLWQLFELHLHLQAAERHAFYSPKAEHEYFAAERMYDFGHYDEAVAHAEKGEATLPETPNLIAPLRVSR
ncbi:MAG: hypothetical protein IVW56_02595 [Candidatus Binataceae bacterium]|nr:hypothetical protein [Candidatus Binataceae bacterium]